MSHSLRTIKLRPRAVQLAAITPITAAALIFSVAASSPGIASAETGTTTTSLSSLKPVSATNGWGPHEVNRSNGSKGARDGRTLTINGQKFYQGLGVHSSSKLTYNLGAGYTWFSTYIGVDDEVGRRGAVRFLVQRDGRTVYTSPVMTGRDSARKVSLSVSGTKSLSLVVQPVGSIAYDHADWGSPRLTKKPLTVPTSPKPTTSTSTTTTAPAPSTTTTTAPATTTSTTTAPAPSTTTTTTAPAPSTGFPSAATTGVPAGTVLKASGSITISTPGAVVSGLDIKGNVKITASNVTFKNSRVTGTSYSVVDVSDSAQGVIIQDVEINGQGTSGSDGSTGIYGPATVLRADIWGVENGVQPSTGGRVEDSWIHNLNAPGSPHIDGIQIDGARSNIVIRHNFIDMREWTQTATVMIDNYFGPVSNVAVDRNLLLGAGYTVYSDGRFDGGSITGVSFTGNRIDNGHWGYASIDQNTPVWTGNVDHSSGAVIQP